MEKFKGTGVALITPFTNTKEVDYKGLGALLKNMENHVDYYVVNGTTAESPTLTAKEKQGILDFVIANNAKKKPIVFGLGGYNTLGLIDIYKEMDLSGVDAILSVSPQYSRPGQKGIIEHFSILADEFALPIILYNVPPRTGSNMEASTTLALAQHENIIGIKEASGSITQCMEIASKMPKDFLLISGDDLLTIPMISIGGAGVISVIANALPESFSKVTKNALAGDFKTATAEMLHLLEVNQLLFAEGNPVGVKLASSLLDLCGSSVRIPLAEASDELKNKMKLALDKL